MRNAIFVGFGAVIALWLLGYELVMPVISTGVWIGIALFVIILLAALTFVALWIRSMNARDARRLKESLNYPDDRWGAPRASRGDPYLANARLRKLQIEEQEAQERLEARRKLDAIRLQREEQRLQQRPTVESRLPLPGDSQGAARQMPVLSAHAGFAANSATRLALGYNRLGEAVAWDVESTPHIRVHGKTQGSGKTNTIKTIVAGAVRQGCHVVVLDRRSFKDWSVYRPYIEAIDNRQPGAFAGAMQQLRTIYQERDKRLGLYGVGNIGQLPRPPQRVFVVVSEFGATCRDTKETGEYDRALAALKDIMSEAGACGVHMIFEDQVVNRNWPPELRGNAEPVTGYLPEDTAIAGGYRQAHELKRHEFYFDGERFKTWDMNSESAQLLAGALRVSATNCLIDVRSFVRSQEIDSFSNERTENIIFLPNERTNEPTNTELQAAVWAWRNANPGSDSQADMRRDMEAQGIAISKGYAHACWHAWPGVDKPSPVAPQTVADQLRRQGVDLSEIRVGKHRLGADPTITYNQGELR